jgi:hypothetical protein
MADKQQRQHPPKESVLIECSIGMNVSHGDDDGIRFAILELSTRRVIGFLRFSRYALSEILTGRSEQCATWQQYRPKKEDL